MKNYNKIKNSFLGMSSGKARNILVRMIMFDMASKLGLDTCFRCGRKISSYQELSIEHKIPWLHNSIDLYWDLENIAFSHTSCNSAAVRVANKIHSPDGTQWCSTCKTHKPVDEFNKRAIGGRNGRQYRCKSCRTAEYKLRTEKRRKLRSSGDSGTHV